MVITADSLLRENYTKSTFVPSTVTENVCFFEQMNLALIDMIKESPEYFYDGVEIASVYGCFPPAVWNGGRNINGYASEDVIKEVLNEFNSRGIPCRFTFTNPGSFHINVVETGDSLYNLPLHILHILLTAAQNQPDRILSMLTQQYFHHHLLSQWSTLP